MSYRKQLVEVKKYNHDRVQIRCANQRKSLTDLNAKYKNLIEENKQLRGLLEECAKGVDIYYQQLSRINDCPRTTTAFWQIEGSKIGLRDLLTRINTALGGSEEK